MLPCFGPGIAAVRLRASRCFEYGQRCDGPANSPLRWFVNCSGHCAVMTSVSDIAELVDVDSFTGFGFKESAYEAHDRHGCPFLILQIPPPRFAAEPGGDDAEQQLKIWEAALQALVVDCLQIAEGDRRLVAELVAATLNTLPLYDECTKPLVSSGDGVPTVFVAYAGNDDWDSWLQ